MDHPEAFTPLLVVHAMEAVLSSTPAACCPECGWYGRGVPGRPCPKPKCLGELQDATEETIESIARNYGVDLADLEAEMEIQRI